MTTLLYNYYIYAAVCVMFMYLDLNFLGHKASVNSLSLQMIKLHLSWLSTLGLNAHTLFLLQLDPTLMNSPTEDGK
jgi:hypothetical protein